MKIPHSETAPPLQKILAIDPGREKCGVAIVTRQGEVLVRRIFRRVEILASLPPLVKQHAVETIVVGDSTSSKELLPELKVRFPETSVVVVDERNSTLAARALYWKAHAPGGWRRLVPLSLQNPPVAIDDYAAVVLALRHLDETGETESG